MPPAKGESGFTLIEALIAMTIFAIGAVMVVPTMYAWVRANTVSQQRDQAGRILDRAADTLAQQGWGSTEWSTGTTTSSFNYAVETLLDNPSYTNWVSYTASQVPYGEPTDIGYAVVGITNSTGQPISRIMKVRIQWTGPAGNNLEQERIVQRNDAP